MKIAVVILNWNGKKWLEQFLPSVIEFSNEATIYVADNASTDNSIEFLKSNYPSVQLILNSENGGYAKGYNDALRQVNADIFCLLNNDVEVSKNWLTPILSTFDQESRTAIIQPKILDYNRKDYFEYAGAAGGYIDKYGFPYCRGRIFNSLERDDGQYNDVVNIFWASGACLFIRKDSFDNLNGFDESFFAHMEEIDLCWRANNLGYEVKYVGESKVYHVGGGTLQNTNPKKTYLNFRNSLFTLVKNANGNLFFLVFTRLALDGIAGLKFILEFKPEHTLAIFKSHFAFYYNFLKLLKQRKTLNKTSCYYKKRSIVWSYFVLGKKSFNRL